MAQIDTDSCTDKAKVLGGREENPNLTACYRWCARQELNLRPAGSKPKVRFIACSVQFLHVHLAKILRDVKQTLRFAFVYLFFVLVYLVPLDGVK